jgi:hypothetical protein
LLASLVLWNEVLPLSAVNRVAVARLIREGIWMGYDPRGRYATEEYNSAEALAQIEADLDRLHAAGFTGIVTLGAVGSLAEIPRLAKDRGLAVIMGVGDPTDREEVHQAALRRNFVDAYCVGFGGLKGRYSLAEVERAATRLKRRTRKPVTTSEAADAYAGSEQLSEFGDWLFPDVHSVFPCAGEGGPRVELAADVERFRDAMQSLEVLARRRKVPLIFHAVAYPFAGVPGASEHEQARFFAGLIEICNAPAADGREVPRVSIVAYSLFNAPKSVYLSFQWNPYIGLFDWAGRSRPAVAKLVSRHGTVARGPVETKP